MLVLAFDTSTATGGVALFRDDQVLESTEWQRQGSHGELLTAKIESLLQNLGIELKQVDALAVGIGPGSFTGVRVAVNAAKSLAFALTKLIYTFDTSEIIAAGCRRTDLPLAILTNAHKNMVFATTFRYRDGRWQRELPLEARDPAKLGELIQEPHLCLGDGFDEYRDLIDPANLLRDPSHSDVPRPESMISLMKNTQPLEWKAVQALYIRDSGAEEKLREGRQK